LNFEILRRDFRVFFGGKEEIYKIQNQKQTRFLPPQKTKQKIQKSKTSKIDMSKMLEKLKS
jgi:hypothetical protein